MQEIDGGCRAFEAFSRYARQTSALATYRYVETFITLLAQLGNRDVLTHFHAALDIYAYLAHDIYLSINNRLVQFVRRDAVAQHTAGFLIALKYGRFIAHRSQIIRATQSTRTATDDGYLLLPSVLYVGAYIHLRHEARLGMQVFLRNEFLHGIDSHGAVYRTTRTSVLTTAVAYTSAYRRERVLAFDEFERLGVLAFCRFLEISLHSDMCRTSGLTRRSAGRIAVNTVLIAIVLCPFVFTPFGSVRQFLLRVGLRSALRA